MKRILVALAFVAAAPFIANRAEAHPCCYGYRVTYYRVQPAYQYYYVAPPTLRPPRWSLGLHATGMSTNQMFGHDPVVLGGLGGHLRLRGYRWAGELAVDGLGGEYLDGRVQRVSVPVQLSALLYLIPEGRFNLYLVGGARMVPTHIRLEMDNLRADQDFVELGLHGGVGAEVILSRFFALTGDMRFFGTFRNDEDPAGKYYAGVDNGVIPSKTTGLQFNLGAAFRF